MLVTRLIQRFFGVDGGSLGLRTTAAIAFRTAVILTSLSIAIFYLVESALEEQVLNNLEANIRERTLRESAVFERMQEVQIRANMRLSAAMNTAIDPVTPKRFDQLFPERTDGNGAQIQLFLRVR